MMGLVSYVLLIIVKRLLEWRKYFYLHLFQIVFFLYTMASMTDNLH